MNLSHPADMSQVLILQYRKQLGSYPNQGNEIKFPTGEPIRHVNEALIVKQINKLTDWGLFIWIITPLFSCRTVKVAHPLLSIRITFWVMSESHAVNFAGISEHARRISMSHMPLLIHSHSHRFPGLKSLARAVYCTGRILLVQAGLYCANSFEIPHCLFRYTVSTSVHQI